MPPETAVQAPLRREDIRRTEDCRHTANASAVLQAALDHGPVARSTIARLVALSSAAVSRLCAELIAAGLLREAPEAAAPKGVGRPHIPVDVDTTRRVACGLHIAARYATLALVNLRGRVIARDRLDHVAAGPEQVLQRIARRIPGFMAEHAGGRTPLGLGVVSGGWVDRGHGIIMENVPLGWRDVPAGLRCRTVRSACGRRVTASSPVRRMLPCSPWPGPATGGLSGCSVSGRD